MGGLTLLKTSQNCSAVEKVPQFLRFSCHGMSGLESLGLSNQRTHFRCSGRPAISGTDDVFAVVEVIVDYSVCN